MNDSKNQSIDLMELKFSEIEENDDITVAFTVLVKDNKPYIYAKGHRYNIVSSAVSALRQLKQEITEEISL